MAEIDFSAATATFLPFLYLVHLHPVSRQVLALLMPRQAFAEVSLFTPLLGASRAEARGVWSTTATERIAPRPNIVSTDGDVDGR